MSEIVKKFQTVKMVFKAGNFFQRDCSFFVSSGFHFSDCFEVCFICLFSFHDFSFGKAR